VVGNQCGGVSPATDAGCSKRGRLDDWKNRKQDASVPTMPAPAAERRIFNYRVAREFIAKQFPHEKIPARLDKSADNR